MLHLIHPVVVHLTLAFLVVGGLCEATGIFVGRERVERFGGVLLLIGTISLLPTLVSGYLALNTIVPTPGSEKDIATHERIGLIVLAVFLVALFWKGWDRGRVRDGNRPMYAVLVVVAVAVALFGAFMGGELVYGHGIGVARG